MRPTRSAPGPATLPPAWEAFGRLLDYAREAGPGAARQRLAGLRTLYLSLRSEAGGLPSLAEAAGETAEQLAATRGVWALWMLRGRLGPLAWEQLELEGAAPVSWEHLIEAAARVAGVDFDDFLSYWIRSDALPDYRLTSASARTAGEGYSVALRLDNRGEGQPRVPVAIRTEEGALHEVAVSIASGAQADLRYPVLTKPLAAAVDPRGVLLTAESAGEWRAVSIRPRWWPFG